jgi:hypothetical protein
MDKVELRRYLNAAEGTCGIFIVNKVPICQTLENPDLNNEPYVSCIPSGTYRCKLIRSPKYGKVYHVQDVPGRSEILIHSGNLVTHTLGCVLTGTELDTDKASILRVKYSKRALRKFHRALDWCPEFELIVHKMKPV